MATSFDSTLASLGIGRSTTTTNSTSSTGAGTESLGQSDFLTLMTAQMQNQDPFDPVDNTQMVAQMAQFSQLSGITEMSTTLKSIEAQLSATTSSDAMSYVGRTVLTEGSTAYPRTAGGFAGSVELDAAATSVNLSITNENGEVVKTVDLGAHDAGTINYDWDGTRDNGESAGEGPFTVTASARNDTQSVTSRTLVWAPVQSVSMPSSGDTILTLPGIGQVSTSAVRSVG